MSPISSSQGLPAPPPLAPHNCVMLDFDGTLVDIVDRPDLVVVDAALLALLPRLAGTFPRRLALVSGRSVAQLEGFLGAALHGVALIGSHGAEIVTDAGPGTNSDRPAALIAAEQAVRAAFEGQKGVIVEVKSFGVALHYRLAPDAEPQARTLVDRIAADSGLMVQEGKMMLELRIAGHDKGTGITALMAQPTFAGTVPVFAGDDVTDEDGFRAVNALGGFGVLVGPDRPSSAQFRLADVAAVRAWLEMAA